ncbi:MAG: MFS transporter [Dehalococcoidia bacterium]
MAAPRTVTAQPPVITGPIVTITALTFVFFSAYLFYFPTLPFFIRELGGRESTIGVLIGISSLTALAARPFVGWATDAWGRRPVVVAGLFIFALNCALYNLPRSPEAVLPLRLMTGISLATFLTGASTYIADVAPPERRGTVISYFGVANSLAFAVGPALGGFIINAGALEGFDSAFTSRASWLSGARTGEFHFTSLFIISAAIGVAGGLVALLLPEARPADAPPPSRLSPRTLFSRPAVFPAVVNFLAMMVFAAMVTFMPLYVRDNGLDNPGTLFMVYAAGVILMRVVLGSFIDRVPRAAVVVPGIGLLAASMATMAATTNVPVFFVAAGLYGLGTGAFQPALMAFTVDRAPAAERGRAMSTFTLGADLGISLGSFALGVLVDAFDYRPMFLVAGTVALLGAATFAAGGREPGPRRA